MSTASVGEWICVPSKFATSGNVLGNSEGRQGDSRPVDAALVPSLDRAVSALLIELTISV